MLSSETPGLQPTIPTCQLRILEHHHMEPLEEARQAKLKHILQAADHELG